MSAAAFLILNVGKYDGRGYAPPMRCLDSPRRCGIIPTNRNDRIGRRREMAVSTMLPELVLRSPEADWDRARWETLPDDGNRYEVIDGVLYMTTAPSNFHQWIIR